MYNQELLSEIKSKSAKGNKSKELLDHILKTKGQDELLKFFIGMLDYEDVLNDYLCDFCDINDCFPIEEDIKKIESFREPDKMENCYKLEPAVKIDYPKFK